MAVNSNKPLGRFSVSVTVDTTNLILASAKLAAAIKNPRTGNTIKRKLDRLERNVRNQIAAQFQDTGAKFISILKNNTRFRFQDTPSYVWESLWGLPGRKVYPPDTIGTFAQSNPAQIEGTFWGERVQQYISGNHFVHNALTFSVQKNIPGKVILQMGYPKLSSRYEKILGYITLGTEKMQARPLIANTFKRHDNRGLFRGAVKRGVQAAVKRQS